MVAELDYAFLAEFAKAENGTLTAVGASFTQVDAVSFPGMLELSVAGRVRRLELDESPVLSIRFFADGEVDDLVSVERVLEDEENAVRYAGKVATVFVLRGPLYLTRAGLYKCELSLNGNVVRTLAFEALQANDQ